MLHIVDKCLKYGDKIISNDKNSKELHLFHDAKHKNLSIVSGVIIVVENIISAAALWTQSEEALFPDMFGWWCLRLCCNTTTSKN